MSRQLSFKEFKASTHSKEIYLFADGIRLIENIAGLFRLADAIGVRKFFLTERKDSYNVSKLKKISRSTISWVPSEWGIAYQNIYQYVPDNALSIALEYTSDSYPIAHLKPDLRALPLLLILGSEVNGISSSVLQQVDEQVHLPMFGKNSSMNVTTAAAMALYELVH